MKNTCIRSIDDRSMPTNAKQFPNKISDLNLISIELNKRLHKYTRMQSTPILSTAQITIATQMLK